MCNCSDKSAEGCDCGRKKLIGIVILAAVAGLFFYQYFTIRRLRARA